MFANINTIAMNLRRDTYKYNDSWKFANRSQIYSDSVSIYRTNSSNPKNKVVCINAGHGTPNGTKQYVPCHPDDTPNVSSGKNCTFAVTVGCTLNGPNNERIPEGDATLELALVVKNVLLNNGYDVLMIREDNNCNLDNIARTVFANNLANCHISIHYDSTETDKGAFYLSIPDNESYKKMDPVCDLWEKHELLGKSVIEGLRKMNVKIYGNGSLPKDLVQTSYSTIPSIDLEVGDKATVRTSDFCEKIASGILSGVDNFFGINRISTIRRKRPVNLSRENELRKIK